jgi:beta-xylosidase
MRVLMGVVGVLMVGCAASEPERSAAETRMSGNPIFAGWYADPDSAVFGGRYWIYPTYSAPYNDQLHFDAFSSPDLVTWTKHERILDSERVDWAWRAMWAPCIAEKDGKYFLFFGANDIQSDKEPGGIGVAVADRPEGPFTDYLGKPLIDAFHNGAQPIDQAVFRDPADGQWYMYYGGWRHCNVARLNDDFTGFVPFNDGSVFREVTPEGYVEGPTMLFRDGKYYFMWSEGGWTGPDYRVAYAVADSPLGPFERVGVILAQDPEVATGAGHHSVLPVGADEWVIVYHRRPLGDTDRNHRVVCVDRLEFGEDGLIVPVRIGFEGVERRKVFRERD